MLQKLKISRGQCRLDNILIFCSQWYFVTEIVLTYCQRYTYRVLQTIQMKIILLCVWAERAVLGSAKTALKFKYEIEIG